MRAYLTSYLIYFHSNRLPHCIADGKFKGIRKIRILMCVAEP